MIFDRFYDYLSPYLTIYRNNQIIVKAHKYEMVLKLEPRNRTSE